MKPVYQRLNLSVHVFVLCCILSSLIVRFIVGQDAYTFSPVEPLGAQSLTIHRATGDIVLNREPPCPRKLLLLTAKICSAKHATTPLCHEVRKDGLRDTWNDLFDSVCVPKACLLLEPDPSCLTTAEYVIILTGREHRARFMGHDIYRIADIDMIPLNSNVSAQNPPHPIERHLLALVRSHFLGGHFLFSYGWDLSTRLQTQWAEQENNCEKSLWEQVNTVSQTKFFL